MDKFKCSQGSMQDCVYVNTIHYITSDYNDNIFNLEKENSQIKITIKVI